MLTKIKSNIKVEKVNIKENIIKVEKVNIKENIIEVDYTVSEDLQKFFNMENKFKIQYGENIEDVPEEIAIIPFVSNVLPIIWLTNSTLEIENLDANYFKSIEGTREAFEQMYPKVQWKGNIEVKNIKEFKEKYPREKRNSIFFSGGVDSTSSLITVKKSKPILITIWGSDIWDYDELGWKEAKETVERFGKQFELENRYLKSNFRKFINEQELTKESQIKLKDSWWHGVQHGIGLLGHVAPYAYKYNIVTHYIPATYTKKDKKVTCASYPTIDESVKFANCNIVHEGFDKTRQQKIQNICDYCKKTNMKLNLRVCYMERGTKLNCCHCEKCYRTILGIIAEKQDPRLYGFAVEKEVLHNIEVGIKNKALITKSTKKMWKEIRSKFLENKSFWKDKEEIKWILKYHI